MASITMNLGKGIQKLKVHVWSPAKEVLSPAKRRDFLIWCAGMLMTTVAGLLFTQATRMTDKTSVVSSLNGVGLIALSIFSVIVLKERVGPREWSAVMMIICGTGMFQFFNKASEGGQHFDFNTLLFCLAGCVLVYAVLSVAANRMKKGIAFVYAAIAGTFLAFMVIFFDIAAVKGEGRPFLASILTSYWLLGFFMGNGAFLFTNMAFFHGAGIVIVPTVNSFMIVVPMILEIFIFKVMLLPVQYLGAGIIVLGVILLTTGGEKGSSHR